MNWKNQVDAYNHRLVSKSTDDMICRRIWKSLGLSGSYNTAKLAEVEHSSGISGRHKMLDIDRMVELVRDSTNHCGIYFPFKITTCEISKFSDIVEKIEDIDTDDAIAKLITEKALPAFIARIKNTKMVLVHAVYPTNYSKFQLVCPCSFFGIPVTIERGIDGLDIVIQDVDQFLSPFRFKVD